jgi:hypothetical protein
MMMCGCCVALCSCCLLLIPFWLIYSIKYEGLWSIILACTRLAILKGVILGSISNFHFKMGVENS